MDNWTNRWVEFGAASLLISVRFMFPGGVDEHWPIRLWCVFGGIGVVLLGIGTRELKGIPK